MTRCGCMFMQEARMSQEQLADQVVQTSEEKHVLMAELEALQKVSASSYWCACTGKLFTVRVLMYICVFGPYVIPELRAGFFAGGGRLCVYLATPIFNP